MVFEFAYLTKCDSFIYVYTCITKRTDGGRLHTGAMRHIFLLFVCEMLHKNAIIKCNKIKFQTQFIFFFSFSVVFSILLYTLFRVCLTVWRGVSSTSPPIQYVSMFGIIHNRLYSSTFFFASLLHYLYPLFNWFHCPRILNVVKNSFCNIFFPSNAPLSFIPWLFSLINFFFTSHF